MVEILEKARKTVRGKTMLTLCAIAASVALPQLIHMIGAISGLGTSLGEVLLPMHFFVFLVGLYAGPAAGSVTGACAPLISFLLSGMPRAASLPFMMIELLGYGLIAGLLSEVKINSFCKLVIAQISGRLLRAGAVLVATTVFAAEGITVASVWSAVATGALGIALQWCILPLLLFRMRALEKDRS